MNSICNSFKWWALKSPNGKILQHTIRPTKHECADEAPESFGSFWSLSSFVKKIERKGYKFVRMEIKEIKEIKK